MKNKNESIDTLETSKVASPKLSKSCANCGRMESDGVVIIRRGSVGRDEEGNFVAESLCNLCCKIVRDQGRRVYRWRPLLQKINELNERRKKRLAAREAERQKRKAKDFERVQAYWKAVVEGTAEKLPQIRKNAEGNFLCSVPACKCWEWGDKVVEHFVVLEKPTPTVVGVCRWQFAALKEAGVKLFAAKGLERCERHLRWLQNGRNGNGYQPSFWRPKRVGFGQPGSGLRKKTKPNREKREADRRAKQLARAAAFDPKAGCGKRHGEKKKTSQPIVVKPEAVKPEPVKPEPVKPGPQPIVFSGPKPESQPIESQPILVLDKVKGTLEKYGFSYEEVIGAWGSFENFLQAVEEHG